ncbi:related to 50S ribosomal protein L35 [Melanopsichium pennsylvanicum]|uniref:Related to 50S ribosomal protein L35 n=1 Tax=Melanopsichium pennsylvanicum TaxID=63383 RepID=A0AAJ4XHD4_9BASI|nr:related to 50S ribosomal protein L35 [Melanopsichium pennsylvanicum]
MIFASTSRLLTSALSSVRTPTITQTSASTSRFTVHRQLLLSSSLQTFTTSSLVRSSPRTKHLSQHGSGNKLKSHSGTKKRWSPLGSGSGKAYQLTFKRGLAGKRHLNSGMARDRLNSLGGTVLSPRGRINRTLRRLLGPSL